MTDEELEQLVMEWMAARGGVATDDDFDALASVLAEHFPNLETATLEETRRVLGLREGPGQNW